MNVRRAPLRRSVSAMAGEPNASPNSRFDEAVRVEREAIRRHELAATRLEAIATEFGDHAVADEHARRRNLRRAATAHDRAEQARARANRARQRLLDEGVDAEQDLPVPRTAPQPPAGVGDASARMMRRMRGG